MSTLLWIVGGMLLISLLSAIYVVWEISNAVEDPNEDPNIYK